MTPIRRYFALRRMGIRPCHAWAFAHRVHPAHRTPVRSMTMPAITGA